MPRRSLFSSLLVLLCLLLPASALAQMRLAVVDFRDPSQARIGRVGEVAATKLTTELVNNGNWTVVSRDQLAAVLTEQGLQHSGIVDPSTAANLGRVLGVDYIVVGSVTENSVTDRTINAPFTRVNVTEAITEVDLQVINVETAVIAAAINERGEVEDSKTMVMGAGASGRADHRALATESLEIAIQRVVRTLEQRRGSLQQHADPASLPIMIANVSDCDVVLNAGAGRGIVLGQQLEVVEVGQEIRDPATGAVLTVEYTTIGLLRVTEVQDRFARATIEQCDARIEVGDHVRTR